MKYKAVPFVASLDHKKPSGEAAAIQLQDIISQHSREGWDYVRLENVSAWVAPDTGCFGIGAVPGYNTIRQVIVFEKQD